MLRDVYGSAAPFKSSQTNMDEIANLENALSTITERETAFETALQDDANAEHLYKTEKAKAFLAADGTEKAREAKAVVESSKYLLDHLKKKAIKEFVREKLKDAQEAQSARQSILSYRGKTNFGYTNQT